MKHPIIVSVMFFLLLSSSVEAVKDVPDQNSKLSAQSIASITLSDIKATPKVEDICAKTENPRLCEKTVSIRGIDAKGTTATNILLEQVQACIDETGLAQKDCALAIKEIGDQDKVLTECYNACTDLYTKATHDLTEAVKTCNGGDMKQTEILADNAMSYFQSCDDAFEEAQVSSPLKETNDFLARLANNGISIARAIKLRICICGLLLTKDNLDGLFWSGLSVECRNLLLFKQLPPRVAWLVQKESGTVLES